MASSKSFSIQCASTDRWSLSFRLLYLGRGLPSKVSIFMWRLLRRLLPFPDTLQRFGFSMPSVCPFCRRDSASLDHCLLSCASVQDVWIYFADIFALSRAVASSIRSQCHSWWLLAPARSATMFYAQLLPCLILWFLWKAYNVCLHEGTAFSPAGSIHMIKREAFLISLSHPIKKSGGNGDFLVSAGLVTGFAAPLQRTTIWVKWLHPPEGRLKLNTDAIFSDAGAAGGACVRGSRGQLIVGLCFRFEASSAMEAETLSLQLAVQWCAAFAMAPFAVEVDSLSLANLISAHDTRIPWRIEPAVSYVRSTLSLWGSSIRHIYREANHVADALATAGLGFNTSKIFILYTHCLLRLSWPYFLM
ncbi:PREDICTED: uncharacterized protein LOC109152089 [Ipomoea nil]|uniref:uncharacterized protein LOC109152089 n=1 Tax=Ipomoea nil TaxID=35883 RepID=UPI000900ADB2|nr:PREDICTED: uncharacterized protein LOC109152089 [Ipomoea nil]